METAFSSEKGALAQNEDACIALPDSGLFVTCDGLGIRKGGDKASRFAVDVFSRWALEQKPAIERARSSGTKPDRDALEKALRSAFQESSKGIFQLALTDPELQGMCTTMDALVVLGTHALVAHVGSGRVYLFRHGELHQLTDDHTQLAHLRRAGKLAEVTPVQQATFARRLMRAVGFREEVQVDVLGVELEAGDRFLMVTDGVWAAMAESELEKIATSGSPPAALLKALHDRVDPLKAHDNFTTIVVDTPRPPESGAEQKIKMLGTVPAFAYLTYQELIRVINKGELVKLPAGKEIWHENDAGGEMMLILSGSVDIVKNGKRINVMGKGDVVGEMSMIDAAPRSASAIAAAATNMLAFPRETLFSLFREEPELAVKFLWGVTMEMNKRLRAVSTQLVGGAAQAAAPVSKTGPLPFHSGKK